MGRDSATKKSKSRSAESTTDDLSAKLEQTVFSDFDTGELSSIGRDRRDLEFEAHLILFAHPEDRMLGTRFRLPPHSTLEIGRSSSADVSMPGVRSLSRHHACLEHHGPVVRIDDLGSTNGTYVNDIRIAGAQRLRSGDRFQVGALHFKFLHEKDPETAYHEAIYHLVTCDGLTGIFNKRKFDEELGRELARAHRHGRPLSLIYFDIDHFKTVNDSHGHLCGDFVLQQIVRQVQPFLRPEQVFARLGGEEFAILCPETSDAGAAQLAEKIRQRLNEADFEYADVRLDITCSFGVAHLDGEMHTSADLYHAADQAMYAAKRAGRNRVAIHGQGDDAPGGEIRSAQSDAEP
ncbi:MAG: GGDEF domain-containing protein [Acidobacteriota bacterium]